MFTGIIEEVGTVKSIIINANNALITINCQKVLEKTKIGDSIAIDGVCQTVTEITSNTFSAEISSETLKITSFSKYKTRNAVNLERALLLGSRLGGHIVSGHVDGLGCVKSIQKQNEFYTLKIELNKENSKYVVKKGSVTVNGISLTIADITQTEIILAIIPHTFENTNLKNLKIGDFVNIEVDILAKYVEKILSTNNNINCKSVVNENFLKENGFF